jgi:hypothetical protein
MERVWAGKSEVDEEITFPDLRSVVVVLTVA